MMRKLLGALAVCAVALIPAAALATPVVATPFNLQNVTVQNVSSGLFVIGHGHGRALTAGGSGNGRWSQVNCQSAGVCEWKDVANGLCWDAGIVPDSGTISEESCQAGNNSELFQTTTGPNGPNNPGYWFWNVYWNGVDGCSGCAFVTQWTGSVLNANIGAGSGNLAVWHVSS